jgi:hypothetical protein
MKFSRSDFEMQRFESRRPSQPVRLQRDTYEDRSKTARHREVSQICLGLRVRNSAMEASCRPPVSEEHFWCLVFTERPLPHIHDPDRFLLNWRRDAAARAAETMTPVTACHVTLAATRSCLRHRPPCSPRPLPFVRCLRHPTRGARSDPTEH